MRVAIDTGPLKSGDSVRGIGVYTRELVSALEKIQKTGSDKFNLYPVDYFSHQSSTINHYDAVHFTRFNPFRISIPFNKPRKTKFVLTIYDLIPLLYPEHYPPGFRGWVNWQINKLLIKKNINAIITISETSKKDICRFIGIPPSKVHVTYLAPRSIFKPVINHESLVIAQKKFSLPNSFAFYVGDINYNKNIPTLVAACKIADIPLVIAGKQAGEIEKMNLNHPELEHLKNIDWSEVFRLGFVQDEDLVKIYNLASIYIHPSLSEGFGLPVLEAMASGTPIVASKTQTITEIAGKSAVYADPDNPDDFADKIKLIIDDDKLRDNLTKKGLENVKEYTWEKTAAETLRIYKIVQ